MFYPTYVHCRRPRVVCPRCGVRQVSAPFERKNARHTTYFEGYAMMLLADMPRAAAARALRCDEKTMAGIVSYWVNRANDGRSLKGLDRLVSDGDVSYAYDAAGNRTVKRGDVGGDVTYALGAGDRLAAWTGGAYEHDAAGCVMHIVRGEDTWDLTWNWRYQLVSVATNGAFAESYSYDALGRRVSTVNAEGTERHVYDENWQVIADIDGDGNVIRSYEWGEGIDQLLAVRIDSRTYTALTDIQGTVWGYADESGAVVARWTYDAWGNVLSEEIADGAEELRSVRYRFHGRERSAATGLVNFRMRWYDPATGRWLSKDPIGLGGGLNLYAFCRNAPNMDNDPFGRCGGNSQRPYWERYFDYTTGLMINPLAVIGGAPIGTIPKSWAPQQEDDHLRLVQTILGRVFPEDWA